jgi:hypothetical protein
LPALQVGGDFYQVLPQSDGSRSRRAAVASPFTAQVPPATSAEGLANVLLLACCIQEGDASSPTQAVRRFGRAPSKRRETLLWLLKCTRLRVPRALRARGGLKHHRGPAVTDLKMFVRVNDGAIYGGELAGRGIGHQDREVVAYRRNESIR